ncbi:MAG: amidohydrolase family protein [Vicinamibacteria bacterium]
MRRAVLASLLLMSAYGFAADAPAIVIRGARVMTVEGGVLDPGTVVITGGKIAAVGRDVPAPAGATVIDGTRKTLYPGLIDGLTTLGLVEVPLGAPGTVDKAELGDVNPQVKAWIALNPHSELIPVARANGLTAALSAPTGGLVSGQSALIRLVGTTPDALVVKTPVAMHLVFPSGTKSDDEDDDSDEPEKKTFVERQEEKKKGQERDLNRLRNLFEDAKVYGRETGKPDMAKEALAPAARGTLPIIVRADNEDDIRGAVAFAEERGLKLILAGGLEAWRCADLLQQKNVAVLLNVLRLPRRDSDPYDAAYANASILEKARVRFAIVSDDDAFTRNLPYQAAMARAYGLSAEAALRAITLSPAEILGVADRMGSIAVGKDANVVLATGDIMDARTSVTAVFIDGAPQSLETRHTRLYERFKDRP